MTRIEVRGERLGDAEAEQIAARAARRAPEQLAKAARIWRRIDGQDVIVFYV